MACAETAAALVELVVALSTYHEEGVPLFPRVLVCDKLSQVTSLLQASEQLEIGFGPRGAPTIKQALKRCAPLARRGWSVYVHREGNDFRFGVLREPVSPVALDLRDSIGDLDGQVRVVCLSQVGDKTVEATGSNGDKLVIYLSAHRTDQGSPREAVERLARGASRTSREEAREPLDSYLRTSLSNSLQRGHGALVAVLNADNAFPASWGTAGAIDGVILHEPIDLADAVEKYRQENSATALARLVSYANLLEGMLSADGITILGSGGTIHGYNLFVRTVPKEGEVASSMVGGARRRAFRVLQSLVDEQLLSGAFFRSADGGAEFHGGA